MEKSKKIVDKEKSLNLVRCPKCGYYNKKKFIDSYGKCNGCKNVLNEQAAFKYNMIKKMNLFKKKQIGYCWRKDA